MPQTRGNAGRNTRWGLGLRCGTGECRERGAFAILSNSEPRRNGRRPTTIGESRPGLLRCQQNGNEQKLQNDGIAGLPKYASSADPGVPGRQIRKRGVRHRKHGIPTPLVVMPALPARPANVPGTAACSCGLSFLNPADATTCAGPTAKSTAGSGRCPCA